jgi:NADPH:quinone reductase
MTKAILIHGHGGPEQLRYEDVAVDAPAAGQARVRHQFVGVNYIDIYHRSGLYPLPSFPSGIGLEAAGVIEALGDGVVGLQVGDRVA